MSNPNQEYVASDEITLKELILKIQEFFWELVKYWMIIVFVIILLGAYLIYDAKTADITYPADLTFMLNDDGGGASQSGLSLIMGSLGLPGGKKENSESLEKIMQLFKTRTVIYSGLLQKTSVGNKEDFLANHILDEYGFTWMIEEYERSVWIDQLAKYGDDFRFKNDSIDYFDDDEQVVLYILYDYVVGSAGRGIKPMMSSSLDEDSGIMALRVNGASENLTIAMLQTLYEKLSNFFIDKAIEKQKKTFDILKEKNDSIRTELASTEYALADFKDTHHNLVTLKGGLRRTSIERKVRILEIMYAESVKNLEISDFALKRRKPYVQVIDKPMRPVPPRGKSTKMAIIYAVLFGSVISGAFIILRKIIRDAMAED